MNSLILHSISHQVARIRLNRPDKRNALTRDMLEQLQAAVKSVAQNPDARVCILDAAGQVFCAGMDLGEMQTRALGQDAEAELRRDSEMYCELLCEIFSLPMPTIALVQGPALAGGVGLALACDMTVAAHAAFFCLPEPARGITAAIVAPLLVHRVGYGSARHLLLSLEKCPADRALRTGLATDVVPNHELTTRVDEIVASILGGSPKALAISKRHLAEFAGQDICDQLRRSVAVSAAARSTSDAREGLDAFLMKRRPQWVEDLKFGI